MNYSTKKEENNSEDYEPPPLAKRNIDVKILLKLESNVHNLPEMNMLEHKLEEKLFD